MSLFCRKVEILIIDDKIKDVITIFEKAVDIIYYRFVSKLLNYYKDSGVSKNKIMELGYVLKNRIYNELKNRDNSSCFII